MTSFLDLHRPGDPLLLPNAWDQGSVRLLEALGFRAVATTSSGAAAALGRLDGDLGRTGTVAHAAAMVAWTRLPVSVDLENGFGHEPSDVALTVAVTRAADVAGLSIEDFDGEGIYEPGLAAERIAAAAREAHAGGNPIVLTARAENFLHGRPDLADTISRLQAFVAAGADVVYAPGLADIAQIRTLVAEVGAPVNVLAVPGLTSVAELADAGVARVSVGGAFAFHAYGAAVEAAQAFAAGDLGWVPESRVRAAAVQSLLRGDR